MPLGRERNSRRLYVAQSIIVVIVAALVLWRPATTAFHTVAFAGEMLPGPLKVQRWLTPEPRRMTTTFLRPDGALDEAEVFVIPGGKQRAAVLIFLGATVHGTDDPEAVKLGWALACTGFAVMFYWSETMGTEARLDAADIPNVVTAFEHLARQEYVDPERVGLAGFSVGASFALAAAADPRIADDIAFVNAFGGYHDLAGLIAQIAAGRALDGATEAPWEVDELTRKVFTNTLLFEPSSHTRDALLESVGSIGQARGLYERLPAGFRSDVAAISPSQYLGHWSDRTVIRVMHDRGDAVIPVGESRRLVAALRRERPDVELYYTETDIFRHVSRTRTQTGSRWYEAHGKCAGICTTSSRWQGTEAIDGIYAGLDPRRDGSRNCGTHFRTGDHFRIRLSDNHC